MRVTRVRFTVRRMMVAVALVGLNLAGADATCGAWPPTHLSMSYGNGRGITHFHADGRVVVGEGNAETGYRRMRTVRPSRPSLARVCAPACAAVAITLMALVLAPQWPRVSVARVAVLGLLLSLSLVALRWWWVLYGGGLPLERLRLGMTKQEVTAVVGPPSPADSAGDCGSSPGRARFTGWRSSSITTAASGRTRQRVTSSVG